MRSLLNFAQVHEALSTYISKTPTKKRYTLERMRLLMDHLGNPQNNLKTIHIAGTSGKTSTSYYCAALLQAAGFTTGLTVSPHIDEVNERAQINLQSLPEDEYCKELSQFLDIVDKSTVTPSYFELLVGFAYWLFDKRHVDYAVVEVGLGGLLDGTNVISREDKICVITDIGFDHTEILGNTLGEIATQKGGIIHERNPVFIYAQPSEIMDVISTIAMQKNAQLNIVTTTPRELKATPMFDSLPDFQQRNLSLAFSATASLTHSRLTEKSLTAVIKTVIPARMEEIAWKGKIIIFDGSHNEQKLTNLRDAINKKYKLIPKVILASFGENKYPYLRENVALLGAMTKNLYLTKFSTNQDQIRHAIEPRVIAATAAPNMFDTIVTESDPAIAWAQILKRPEKIIIVTGSFYLLNDIRPLVKEPGEY